MTRWNVFLEEPLVGGKSAIRTLRIRAKKCSRAPERVSDSERAQAMQYSRHPRLRRFSWHPVVVLFPLAYFAYRLSTHGVSVTRVLSFAFMCVWFVLAVINFAGKGRFLDWLYSDEETENHNTKE